MNNRKQKLLLFIRNHQENLNKIMDGSIITPNKKAFIKERIFTLKKAIERYKRF